MGEATSSAPAISGRRVPERRGSSFSDKQVYAAVKDGKAVQVRMWDGPSVLGFIYGMDDFHWGIVTLGGERILVHKSAPALTITEHLLGRQPDHTQELIEPVVAPFREYVMRTHFRASPTNS